MSSRVHGDHAVNAHRFRRTAWLGLLVALAAGAALRADGLAAGYRSDDYVQLALLDGAFPIARGPLDLYWFSGRDARENAALMDAGYLPWWTAPGFRVAMLRPLASGLRALEHALSIGPFTAHLQSLLWWALFCAAAARLYWLVLPPRVALLSTLLFALDESHTTALCWLAQRSTAIAGAFGTLALALYVSARARGRPAGLKSVLALALALLAGEYALGLGAYFVAYEVLGTREPFGRRARAVSPVLALCALYLLLHATLGYGVRDSGFYLSPLERPLAFVAALGTRLPALLGELTLSIPADYFHSGNPLRGLLLERQWVSYQTMRDLPSWPLQQAAYGWLGFVVAALLLWRARRSARGATHPAAQAPLRSVSWLAAGALLSLLPAASSLPSSRLLSAAALGSSAAIALLACELLDHARRRRSAPYAAVAVLAAVALLTLHAALPALRDIERARGFTRRAAAERQAALAAPIDQDSDVLLVSSADFTTAAHVPWVRRAHGLPVPRSMLRLSGANDAHDLSVLDGHTLRLRTLSNQQRGAFAGSLYRSADALFSPGAHVKLAAMTVTVLATRDRNPSWLRFEFARPLAQLSVLVSGRDGLSALALPPPGGRLRLPRAMPPALR